MQRRSQWLCLVVSAGFMMAVTSSATRAQELWKYTDKDGKVTYSDKAPKKGESAQLVPNDPSANVIEAPKNARQGAPGQRSESVKDRAAEREKTRASERESRRDKLRDALEAAKEQLEKARAALEQGRTPAPDEVQIVVGRSPTGAPTGANSQQRKPEYYTRITSLEEAIKSAEAKVEIAEQNYREAQ